MFDTHSIPVAQSHYLRIYPLMTSATHKSELCRIEFAPKGNAFLSMDQDLHYWKEGASGHWTKTWSSEEYLYVTFFSDQTLCVMNKDHEDHEDTHFTVLSPDGHGVRAFHCTLSDGLGYLYIADEQYFLTVDWEMQASLWNHNLSKREGHFLLKSDAVDIQDPRFFAFTPDSHYLFFLSGGRIVRCAFDWKKKTLTEMIALAQPRSDFEVLEVSPDGHVLAGSDTGRNCVDLYETSSLNHLISFPVPVEELPQRLAFSPDGNFLACAGSKGSVSLWNLRTYQQEVVFMAHPDLWVEQIPAIGDLAWSPRGDLLVTGGASTFLRDGKPDYTVKLWRIETQHV